MAKNRHHPSRRKVITAIGAGAATAITAPPLFARSARAAGRTIKIGMVSPQTGPIAAFGEADQWVVGEAKKALANGINTLLRNRDLAIRYGKAGRKRVEAHFSWSSIAKQVEALYAELIRSP